MGRRERREEGKPSMGVALERSLGVLAWLTGTTMLGMTLLAVGELLAG